MDGGWLLNTSQTSLQFAQTVLWWLRNPTPDCTQSSCSYSDLRARTGWFAQGYYQDAKVRLRCLGGSHFGSPTDGRLGPDSLESKLDELLLQLFLDPDLKMIDIAKHLSVSEYKVSRAIRSGSCAANFNHYVNGFRLAHAKRLLLEPDSQDWTILVISLESGFASLAPFNRSFKAQEGCTPNQYRRRNTDWCSKEDIKVNRA